MDELIRREEAIEAVYGASYYGDNVRGEDAEEAIRDLPTIDAAPVVHAVWVFPLPKPYSKYAKRCSACQSTQTYGLLQYCPNCGAKMDSKEISPCNTTD